MSTLNYVGGSIRETQSASYELLPKTVAQLAEGFDEDVVTGKVVAFGGKLILSPEYQREFIYGRKQSQAVIETIINGAPLNNMYWFKNEDGTFECGDGRQRSQSICQFVHNKWTVNFRGNNLNFRNLPRDIKERILNYQLQIYEVNGTHSDKLHWFRTTNIPGSPLTEQELRNSIFTGTWLTAAKEYFSKMGEGAANRYGYLTGGVANRQEILEIALSWITGDEERIEDYMAEHQHDKDAEELKNYFKTVCGWAEQIIGDDTVSSRVKLGKSKKGEDWGSLYRKYHDTFIINREEIDKKLKELKLDDEVNEKPNGFYPYIISGNPQFLFQRQFSKAMKEKKFIEQNGKCAICGCPITLGGCEADHIIPWSDGGKTVYANLQVTCKDCNSRKSNGVC
jgi:hypothetical protein